jgi:hypothetical protein
MGFHCFTFQNFHEDIGCVTVGFEFNFFETTESNKNIFVGVRLELKFHGLDFKGFFVEFLFDDKRDFDFIKSDVLDVEIFINEVTYP